LDLTEKACISAEGSSVNGDQLSPKFKIKAMGWSTHLGFCLESNRKG